MRHINRNRKLSRYSKLNWCYVCDACKVSNSEPCPVCGKRDAKTRMKVRDMRRIPIDSE